MSRTTYTDVRSRDSRPAISRHPSADTSGCQIPTVYLTPFAKDRLRATVGSLPAESGCLLLGKEDELNADRIIIHDIIFDQGARTTSVTYTLNTAYLNPLIKKAWQERKLAVIGVAHSHPYGCSYPSWPDIEYFRKMFSYMPRKYLVTPIIFTDPDGGFRIFTYVLTGPQSNPVPVAYEVLKEAPVVDPVTVVSTRKKEEEVPVVDPVTVVSTRKKEVEASAPVVKRHPRTGRRIRGRKYLRYARRAYLRSRSSC